MIPHGTRVCSPMYEYRNRFHNLPTGCQGVDNIETQPMLPSEAAVYAKAYEAPNKSAAAAVGNEEKPVCTEALAFNICARSICTDLYISI